MTPPEQLPVNIESTTELLARRAQLQEWLGRLDQVGGDIPAQVAGRVRADYEQRLAGVIGELSAHSEVLAADRERLDAQLTAAAERHDGAVDALEEARLRHMIGELSAEEWEARRPGLEEEVDTAAAERAGAEQEIAAMEDLFAQISEGAAAPDEPAVEERAGGTEPEVEPASASGHDFAGAADEWDPELPMIDADEEAALESLSQYGQARADAPAVEERDPASAADSAREQRGARGEGEDSGPDPDLVEITSFAAAAEALADEVDPAPAEDDYAFLEELDRAIAATAPETGGTAPGEEESSEETRPQPGLKCPDCGYSNDPAAWYCGVCGVDLA